MKIHALKIRGIGRFYEEASLPIGELGDAQLVALVGGNGAGKTTMAECVPGALYRSMPSRGPLHGMANGKDSLVELVVETDQTYTLRVVMDGTASRPKGSAYILDASGQPLNDGKFKSFDATVARLYPDASVLLSSVFAAQTGEGRFLDLPASARKQLFAKLLGLAQLEELSTAAGERHREVNALVKADESALNELSAQAVDLEVVRDLLVGARATESALKIDREAAETTARQYQERYKAWADKRIELRGNVHRHEQELSKAESALQSLNGQIRDTRESVARVSGRIELLKKRLADRDELEAAASSVDELRAKIDAAVTDIEAERVADANHRKAVDEWRDTLRTLEDKLAATTRATDQDARDKKHRATMAAEKLEQALGAAGGLGQVPCGGEGDFSGCPLIQTATAARAALEALRTENEHAQAAVETLSRPTRAEVEAQEAIDALSKPPVREARPIHVMERELGELRSSLSNSQQAATKLGSLDDVETDLGSARTEHQELIARETELVNARPAKSSVVSDLGVLVKSANEALHRHDGAEPIAPQTDLVGELRDRESAAAAQVATLLERLKQAEASSVKCVELSKAIEAKIAECDDWRHLQQALGRNGIQALEIDAAGPEVSGLTNDLLHACYGSRFSASLETTELKADGRGTKEVFDLRVIDTERGTEGSAGQLSGGEKVMISEALSLSIAVYNTRKSSRPLRTLFRDECSGALSSANATRYVEMLRKAMQLGGFVRCYFVAHQPHLWAMADKVVQFKDGGCWVAGAEDAESVINKSEAA